MAVVTADVPKETASAASSSSSSSGSSSRESKGGQAKNEQQNYQSNRVCPYTGGGINVTSGTAKDPEFGNWYETDNLVENLRTYIPRASLIDSPPEGFSPDGENFSFSFNTQSIKIKIRKFPKFEN